MTANLLVIKERKRQNPILPADPSDFEFDVGESVDPQTLVTNPRITLYCLDHANQQALFVENAPGVDLSQAPFMYQTQYENTVNLFSVSYQTFHELANDISLDGSQLVFVYSVGRAGSTLIGSALNAVDGVVGLSEPDVFTQLVTLRGYDKGDDAEISRLVESCMKLQCKPTERISNPTAWAIKFRSFSIEIGDLLYKHFPDAKNIFLYRDLESWTLSAGRAFMDRAGDREFLADTQMFLSQFVPAIAKHVNEDKPLMSVGSLGAQVWLAAMERYIALSNDGVPMSAFRFEDIKAAPQEAVKKIIEYCNFYNVDLELVYKSLERDSQAGSPISQEILAGSDFKLTDEIRADLAQALAAHSVIKDGHIVVPSTRER